MKNLSSVLLTLCASSLLLAEEVNIDHNFTWTNQTTANDILNINPPASNTSNIIINVNQTVYASEVNQNASIRESDSTKLNSVTLNILENAFIDVNGGNINTYNASGVKSTAVGNIFISNSTTSTVRTSVTNANSWIGNQFLIDVNSSWGGAKGGTIWEIKNPNALYEFNGCIGVGMTEKIYSGIEQSAGVIKTQVLFLAGNQWSNGSTRNSYFTLNGGKVMANTISLGNTASHVNTTSQYTANAVFNFDGGEIATAYANSVTIQDRSIDSETAAKKGLNQGKFQFLFGEQKDSSANSKNVFSSNIYINDSVELGSIAGTQGGFTIKNGKTLENSATRNSGVNGKISVIEGSTLKIIKDGAMFQNAEIYTDSSSILNLTNLSAGSEIKSTLTGEGTILGTDGLLITGTIAPGADGQTQMLAFNTSVTLSSLSTICIDVLSADFYDQVSVGLNSINATDNSLGKIVFDVTNLQGETVKLYLSNVIEANNSQSIDWTMITAEKLGDNYEMFVDYATGEVTFSQIPEPATMAMFISVIALLASIKFRQKNKEFFVFN